MSEESAAQTIRISSWDQYIAILNSKPPDAQLFRGQRDPGWKLASPWERRICWMGDYLKPIQTVREMFYGNCYAANRDRFLKVFRDSLSKNDPRVAEWPDDQLWALGRHHGLITPLLDWTWDGRIAAFFAFSDHCKWMLGDDPVTALCQERQRQIPNVGVWELSLQPCPFSPTEFELVTSTPSEFAGRQQAQRGVFTRLATDKHFDVAAYLQSRGLRNNLKCYELSPAIASTAFDYFERTGINHASLFPDPQGAAEHSNFRCRFMHSTLEDLARTGDGHRR
ncbi:MAG TPA: FRG domain-containing protein [Phycisphaerae bacterium]|jgi:hypothetical protein